MPIKSVKIKISKKKTDRQTDTHESDYRGHLFRVSGVFPSRIDPTFVFLFFHIKHKE